MRLHGRVCGPAAVAMQLQIYIRILGLLVGHRGLDRERVRAGRQHRNLLRQVHGKPRHHDQRRHGGAKPMLPLHPLHHLGQAQRHAVVVELGVAGDRVRREALPCERGLAQVVGGLLNRRPAEVRSGGRGVTRNGHLEERFPNARLHGVEPGRGCAHHLPCFLRGRRGCVLGSGRGAEARAQEPEPAARTRACAGGPGSGRRDAQPHQKALARRHVRARHLRVQPQPLRRGAVEVALRRRRHQRVQVQP